MSQTPNIGSLAGKWTYRSFVNNPDLSVTFDSLEFGRATLTIAEAPMGVLQGTIGGTGWSLTLNGSINYGDPYSLRFQGKDKVGSEEWVYDYAGYVIKAWPDGVNQTPAIVGSIVRTAPHSGGSGGRFPGGRSVLLDWRMARAAFLAGLTGYGKMPGIIFEHPALDRREDFYFCCGSKNETRHTRV